MGKKTVDNQRFSELVDISTLSPDPANVRTHNEKNLAAIKGSLKRFGQQKPIIVDESGVVIAGNGTLEAAKALGWDQIRVERSALKGTDRTAFAIADNRTAELAAWDDPALAAQLQALKESDFDVGEIGFSEEEITALSPLSQLTEGDPDAVPELQPEAVSKRGEIYELGVHRLMCGDSTSAEDVGRLMDGKKAELLFTSPPYSDMREYSGNDVSVSTISNFIPTFSGQCRYMAFNLGIQRKDRAIVEYWTEYTDKAKASGKIFLAWNVWWKNTISIGQQNAFMPIEHEWIFVFGDAFKDINREEPRKTGKRKDAGNTRRQVDGSVTFSSIGKQEDKKELGSVFNSNPELGKIRKEHPATFPVVLPERYILAITGPGEIIVEPFCGSGTTLIAAAKTGRICYGMEISPQYCDVIRRRWTKYAKENKIDPGPGALE